MFRIANFFCDMMLQLVAIVTYIKQPGPFNHRSASSSLSSLDHGITWFIEVLLLVATPGYASHGGTSVIMTCWTTFSTKNIQQQHILGISRHNVSYLTYLSIYLLYLSVCLSVCPSVYTLFSLPVCPRFWHLHVREQRGNEWEESIFFVRVGIGRRTSGILRILLQIIHIQYAASTFKSNERIGKKYLAYLPIWSLKLNSIFMPLMRTPKWCKMLKKMKMHEKPLFPPARADQLLLPPVQSDWSWGFLTARQHSPATTHEVTSHKSQRNQRKRRPSPPSLNSKSCKLATGSSGRTCAIVSFSKEMHHDVRVALIRC